MVTVRTSPVDIAGANQPAKPDGPVRREVHHCRRRWPRLDPERREVRKRWAVVAAMALDRITLEAMEG